MRPEGYRLPAAQRRPDPVGLGHRRDLPQRGRAAHLAVVRASLGDALEEAPGDLAIAVGFARLADRLGLGADDWFLTYQSRFGREEWLQPYTDKTLEQWGQSGLRTVDVVCPGFAADCLETLEEIAVENDEVFRHAGGGQLRYISALNEEPGHVATLAALVRRHLQGWPH